MIDSIYLDPVYWVLVVVLLAVGALLTRSRPLGFRFVCLLLLSQYAVHSALLFGPTSPVTLFCAVSWALFVGLSVPVVGRLLKRRFARPLVPAPTGRFDAAWFQVSRLFLILYFATRLVVYPFSTGDFDISQRLVDQQNDRLIFFLAQVTIPALAACMAVWLRHGRRLTWIDLLAIVLTIVALVGGDSKATLLPIALAFFGALEMTGRRLREFRRLAIPAAGLATAGLVRLLLYFPKEGPLGVADTMLYRIAANTDSLEYLAVSNLRPGDFPFAGVPALMPYVTKMFGYRFDYSPGVWLYGQRFGDYTGFGPNSGPVLDYFGNIGWAGLAVVALAALTLSLLRRRSAPAAVAAASVIPVAFVDVTLFDLPVLFWGAVGVLLALACARPVADRARDLSISPRVRRLCLRLDTPLPRFWRRAARHRASVRPSRPRRRSRRALTEHGLPRAAMTRKAVPTR